MPAKYNLERRAELAAVKLCCYSRPFWGRLGRHLEPERLRDVGARHVAEACRATARDSGWPGGTVVVVQRLRRWHEEGLLDEDAFNYARALVFQAADHEEEADVEALANELAPVLRRMAEQEALERALDAHGKKQPLERATELLAAAKRIGAVDATPGLRLGPGMLDQVFNKTGAPMLPLGVSELDAALQGGVWRGTLCVAMGSPNSGKSMMLDHIAANCIAGGHPVVLATLEMSTEEHYSRVLGNLTGMDFLLATKYPDQRAELGRRVDDLAREQLLSFCSVRDFPARATSVADIEQWVTAEEEQAGLIVDAVLVDYAALLCAPGKKVRHEEMTAVAEELRDLAVRRDKWVWTAHQTTAEGMGKKCKTVDNEHAAESKGVPRTADTIITLNPGDEGQTMTFFVSKNRHGKRGDKIEALPTDFEHGRICCIQREGWPW